MRITVTEHEAQREVSRFYRSSGGLLYYLVGTDNGFEAYAIGGSHYTSRWAAEPKNTIDEAVRGLRPVYNFTMEVSE